MPVTVDLPLVPPTATLRCAALSSLARNCGRVRCVRPSSLARTTSGTVGLDRGGGDQGHALLQARSVLREQLDAERAQIVELVRRAPGVERAVRARDLGAAGADDGGERQHAAAADAAEEDGRIDHRARPIGGSRGPASRAAIERAAKAGKTTIDRVTLNPDADALRRFMITD